MAVAVEPVYNHNKISKVLNKEKKKLTRLEMCLEPSCILGVATCIVVAVAIKYHTLPIAPFTSQGLVV